MIRWICLWLIFALYYQYHRAIRVVSFQDQRMSILDADSSRQTRNGADGKGRKSLGGPESCALLVIKFVQLSLSLYFVYALYQLGTYWILMAACIAVPIYGIYLTLRAPHQTLDHPLAYIRYRALQERRGWTRVDGVISATMSFILFCFSAILLFGYFHVSMTGTQFLLSAISAFLLSFLYMLNALINARQLQTAKIEFLHWGHDWPPYKRGSGNYTTPGLFSTLESRRSPVDNGADFLSIKSPMPIYGLHNSVQQPNPYGLVKDNIDHGEDSEKPRGEDEASFTFQQSYDSAPSLEESAVVERGTRSAPMLRLSHPTAEVLEVSIPVLEKCYFPHSSSSHDQRAPTAVASIMNYNSDTGRTVPYKRERQPYNRVAVNPTTLPGGDVDHLQKLEKTRNGENVDDVDTASSTASAAEQVLLRNPPSLSSTPATSYGRTDIYARLGFNPRSIDASASDTERATPHVRPPVWSSGREFIPHSSGKLKQHVATLETRTEL